jgi:hypothetical protein
MSRFVVLALAAVAIAAVVDAARNVYGSDEPASGGRESRSPSHSTTSRAAVTTATAVPRCKTQQLAFRLQNLGGGPALALVHAWAGPCRTPRLPISVALLDRRGQAVDATVGVQPTFAPSALSPNAELSAPFNFVYRCGQPRPVRALAEAGPYSTRGRLPEGYGACLHDLGP